MSELKKLYEIEGFESKKVRDVSWVSGSYIHIVESEWVNQNGRGGNISYFNKPIWEIYEEPKDDNAIDNLCNLVWPDRVGEQPCVYKIQEKINELIERVNKLCGAKK